MTNDVDARTQRYHESARHQLAIHLDKFSTLKNAPCKEFFSRTITPETKFHEDLTALRPAEKNYSAVSPRMALTAVLAGLQSLTRVTILGGGRFGLLADHVSD